jgi:pimeloyl-ACP methyl ester carboxylesterase
MLNHIEDIVYLLDFVGIKQFTLHGVSGGGPNVLAAAYYFPSSRLLTSSILCGTLYPDYEQVSLYVHSKLKSIITRYLPFWNQYGFKYNLGYALVAKNRRDRWRYRHDQASIRHSL